MSADREQGGDRGSVGPDEARGILDDVLADLPGVVYRCRNDRDWTMLGLTANVEELTGYAPSELVDSAGLPFVELIHPGDRERVRAQVDAALEEDATFRVAYRIETRAGEERWVLEQGCAVRQEGDTVLTGYIQDVTAPIGRQLADQKEEFDRAQRQGEYLELLQSVTAIANEESSFAGALRAAIPVICEAIGFDVGHAFMAGDEDDEALRSSGIWYLTDETEGMRPFRDATEAAAWSRGRGLLGRVMQTGSAEWVEDVGADPDFHRVGDRGRSSVESGLAVPVMSGTRTLAVLEFYTVEPMSSDAGLRRLLEQVGVQLGRVWEREQSIRGQRTGELRFRQLAENLEAVLVLTSLAGETLYLSSGFERLTGRESVDDWRQLLDLAHPEDRDRLGELFSDPQRAPYQTEYRIVRPDGETRWIRQSGFPIRDDQGEVYRIGGLAEDVTEEHRARERLEETTRLLERTISSLEEAVIVVDSSGAGRGILEVNEAAERMFGLSREEMVGGTTEKLHVDRESFERFGAESRPALRRQGAFRGNFPLRRKDGTTFEAEQTVTLLNPEEGLDGGVVSVVRDVSQRERAEARLRESEARFRQIAEHIDDVFWIASAGGGERRIEYVSPAYREVWGRSPEELHADPMGWAESIHPDDRDRVVGALARQAEGDYEQEYRIVRPDGTVRWVWDRAFPVKDERGTAYRIIGVAEDITERKALELQLRGAQKMEAVGRLAGGIAHDFNNLLTVIRGQCDLLLLDLDASSPLREELETIRSSADRAARLTGQLLAFSREQVLRPRIVDLNEVVADMEQLLVRVLGEDIAIETDLSAGLPPVEVDPGQLEQVLMNLALNAREAMPEGGTLRVSTTVEELSPEEVVTSAGLRPGTYVRLAVADTGSGMDAETRDRIFEPFFTTKKERGGTGLGLSMSYGIIKQSGGTIHVDSEPGRGSTFLVRFPPAEGDPESAPSAADGEADDAELSGLVLVIEDDRSVRQLTTRVLDRAGFEVRVAEDAETGIRVLEQEQLRPDLILTDLVLPGISGRVLVEQVRERFPGLPVILMSGYAEGLPGSRGDLPADIAFIQKPFSPDGLLQIVREQLGRR